MIFIKLCKRMKIEFHSKDSFIFLEGDESNDKFYMIVSGVVSIIIPNKEIFPSGTFEEMSDSDKNGSNIEVKDEIDESEKERNIKRAETLQNSLKMNIESNKLIPLSPHKRKMTQTFHKGFRFLSLIPKNSINIPNTENVMKNDLFEGEYFGERVLFSKKEKEKKRSASAQCKTDVVVLIILKDDFIEISKKFNRSKKQKFNFMTTLLPGLRSVTSNALENMIFSVKEDYYEYGKVIICEETEAVNGNIFIVYKGNCNLDISLQSSNKEGIPLIYPMTISNLRESCMFGEEILEQMYKLTYKYTVTVTSAFAKIFSISKSSLSQKFPKDVLQYIIDNFVKKERWRERQMKFLTKQLPIINSHLYNQQTPVSQNKYSPYTNTIEQNDISISNNYFMGQNSKIRRMISCKKRYINSKEKISGFEVFNLLPKDFMKSAKSKKLQYLTTQRDEISINAIKEKLEKSKNCQKKRRKFIPFGTKLKTEPDSLNRYYFQENSVLSNFEKSYKCKSFKKGNIGSSSYSKNYSQSKRVDVSDFSDSDSKFFSIGDNSVERKNEHEKRIVIFNPKLKKRTTLPYFASYLSNITRNCEKISRGYSKISN